MTGLASVLVVIGIASAIFSSANREAPVAAVGAPNATVVANIADGGNSGDRADGPLAELGVEPSTASADQTNTAAPRTAARH